MNIINLTPHPIVVIAEDGEPVTFPASGTVARVTESRQDAGDVCGIPVSRIVRSSVENLPQPEPGTIYIVSGIVLSACAGRADVFAPDTGAGAVRDDAGRIIGTRGFIAA